MSEEKKNKSLEDKLKDKVEEYNEKLADYRSLADDLNKMLGAIEELDKLVKEKNG